MYSMTKKTLKIFKITNIPKEINVEMEAEHRLQESGIALCGNTNNYERNRIIKGGFILFVDTNLISPEINEYAPSNKSFKCIITLSHIYQF